MSNTSATGGPLIPAASPPAPYPVPLQGEALDDFFQAVIVGITGLDPKLVRPRWQQEPPNLPNKGATWMAIGMVEAIPDTNAVELHNVDGLGTNELQRHEELDLLLSAYGPLADAAMAQLRDGLQIAQNREVLQLAGVGHIETGHPRIVPEYVKDVWLRRVDMHWRVRRGVIRTYPVLSLLSAQGTLNTEIIQTSLNVSQ